MKSAQAILTILFVLSFVLTIVIGVVFPLFTETFYRLDSAKNHFAATERAINVIEFLHNKAVMDPTVFDSREISHMQDVKQLYDELQLVWVCSFMVLLVCGVVIFQTNRTMLFKAIKYGSYAALSVCLVLLIGGIFFQQTFQWFHDIFFIPGSYMFSENEILPTLFPFGFFLDSFLAIVLSSALIAGLFLAFGTPKSKKIKK